MPVTINTTQVKYRNSNGNFTSLSAIGDTSKEVLLNEYQIRLDNLLENYKAELNTEKEKIIDDFKRSIAIAFDQSKSYTIGDYVLYSDKLYKFIKEHTAGEWEATDVEEVEQ